jgi:hypothetical protein
MKEGCRFQVEGGRLQAAVPPQKIHALLPIKPLIRFTFAPLNNPNI